MYNEMTHHNYFRTKTLETETVTVKISKIRRTFGIFFLDSVRLSPTLLLHMIQIYFTVEMFAKP